MLNLNTQIKILFLIFSTSMSSYITAAPVVILRNANANAVVFYNLDNSRAIAAVECPFNVVISNNKDISIENGCQNTGRSWLSRELLKRDIIYTLYSKDLNQAVVNAGFAEILKIPYHRFLSIPAEIEALTKNLRDLEQLLEEAKASGSQIMADIYEADIKKVTENLNILRTVAEKVKETLKFLEELLSILTDKERAISIYQGSSSPAQQLLEQVLHAVYKSGSGRYFQFCRKCLIRYIYDTGEITNTGALCKLNQAEPVKFTDDELASCQSKRYQDGSKGWYTLEKTPYFQCLKEQYFPPGTLSKKEYEQRLLSEMDECDKLP